MDEGSTVRGKQPEGPGMLGGGETSSGRSERLLHRSTALTSRHAIAPPD
jgi:hypothetical protein